MKPRTTVSRLGIVALLAVLPITGTSPVFANGGKTKPNIIFFLADDHRYDVMGCAGHPIIKTPTLDKLAKHGVYYRNAFVTTSICAASRASFFTGLHERTHLYTFGTPPIEIEHTAVSYATLVRAIGYRTGFIGKFGVAVAQGQKQKMFDVFVPLRRAPYFKKQPDGTLRHRRRNRRRSRHQIPAFVQKGSAVLFIREFQCSARGRRR